MILRRDLCADDFRQIDVKLRMGVGRLYRRSSKRPAERIVLHLLSISDNFAYSVAHWRYAAQQ
jgi:hypothetical protein